MPATRLVQPGLVSRDKSSSTSLVDRVELGRSCEWLMNALNNGGPNKADHSQARRSDR